jgi:methylenetetrahydrofolate reductase (NADPH)
MSGASTAQRTTAAARADEVAAVADFTRGFSVEATRPSADDVTALAAIVHPGTHVYISAVAHRPLGEIVDAAANLRKAGLEPVPHLAVRNFTDAHELEVFLARLRDEADVHRLLVIAGDRDQPAGDFRRAVEVIDGGILQRHGIRDIGIAGYPDGHPRIPQHDLEVALADKVAAAEAVGVGVHVVTQFCFEPKAILAWIRRLRSFGMEHPVRIGLAGPTSLSTLLRYAQRCGVRASAQALARQTGLMRQLFAMSAPDPLVRALAEARAGGLTGEIAPHFFSFGGLARSARWAQAVADGRIAIEPGEGFRVDPPPA